jgi:hypothetical protein
MFCNYCGTRAFETDRCCPACGAPPKHFFEIQEKVFAHTKGYTVSVADAFGYDRENDNLLFTGKTLLNSEPTNISRSDTNAYYWFNEPQDILVCDTEWKMNYLSSSPIKLVLIAQVIFETENQNNIQKLKITIPSGMMDGQELIRIRPLLITNLNCDAPIYAFIEYKQ